MQRATLCGTLAAKVTPKDLRAAATATGAASAASGAGPLPTLRAAPLLVELQLRDNRLHLAAPPALPPTPAPAGAGDTGSDAEENTGPTLTWSNVEIPALVSAVTQAGLGTARVEPASNGTIVHLPRADTLLHLEPGATHVFCDNAPRVRKQLRHALLQALPHI
ncbi:hypothetical protein O0L34_g14895 [Tuta absoluta]|nr:hypothetical protein O0L34_g14895 [Tuta absoluta]